MKEEVNDYRIKKNQQDLKNIKNIKILKKLLA